MELMKLADLLKLIDRAQVIRLINNSAMIGSRDLEQSTAHHGQAGFTPAEYNAYGVIRIYPTGDSAGLFDTELNIVLDV